ncbi:tryptophan--tRNA ligase [Archaeoglobus neptunius]|uniref:tryptophan--tRNA ligase n=1 Tax=Archaeoglobus neptunius TaxID=2798580 RepID=UPI0019281604|nr:tryptophan--tRNA ligase [Archaeoglobus neptunius]
MQVTPWDVEGVIDYNKLIRDFGMQPFSEVLDEIDEPHILMRRGAIFGHRDYWRIVNAMKKGIQWAVMSGFMPSGHPHFGHKMTMDEIVWHQRAGGRAFVAIADMEAHAVRGLSWEKTREIGLEYIKSIIALGLTRESVIYFQSKSSYVKDLAFELSAEVNFSELRAIYGFNGDTKLAKMFITSIQAADILHPQLSEFGGPKPVVVPVGADQDPHMRLTRDLAARASIFSFEPIEGGLRIRSRKGKVYLEALSEMPLEVRFYEEHADIFGERDEIEEFVREIEVKLGGFAFVPPSSTYHRFTTGLTGGKMSSSKPESYISLLDKPEDGARKVMKAFTGGRATAEEQRRLGGQPEKCVVFELYSYHLIQSDEELRQIESDCREGRLLCGKCKRLASELVKNFLEEHREKIGEAEGMLEDYFIIM